MKPIRKEISRLLCEALQKVLGDSPPSEELEASLRVHVPVHFGFDQDGVELSGREVLDRFAGVANRYYPGAHLTVEGFTDPAGSAAYNLRLGQRRADAVKSYLVAQGITTFVELGSKDVLTALLKRISAAAAGYAAGTPEAIAALV